MLLKLNSTLAGFGLGSGNRNLKILLINLATQLRNCRLHSFTGVLAFDFLLLTVYGGDSPSFSTYELVFLIYVLSFRFNIIIVSCPCTLVSKNFFYYF